MVQRREIRKQIDDWCKTTSWVPWSSNFPIVILNMKHWLGKRYALTKLYRLYGCKMCKAVSCWSLFWPQRIPKLPHFFCHFFNGNLEGSFGQNTERQLQETKTIPNLCEILHNEIVFVQVLLCLRRGCHNSRARCGSVAWLQGVEIPWSWAWKSGNKTSPWSNNVFYIFYVFIRNMFLYFPTYFDFSYDFIPLYVVTIFAILCIDFRKLPIPSSGFGFAMEIHSSRWFNIFQERGRKGLEAILDWLQYTLLWLHSWCIMCIQDKFLHAFMLKMCYAMLRLWPMGWMMLQLTRPGMVLRITPVAGGLKAAQYAAMREMTLGSCLVDLPTFNIGWFWWIKCLELVSHMWMLYDTSEIFGVYIACGAVW